MVSAISSGWGIGISKSPVEFRAWLMKQHAKKRVVGGPLLTLGKSELCAVGEPHDLKYRNYFLFTGDGELSLFQLKLNGDKT